MTIDAARKWLILSSPIITALQMLFLIVCPTIGFPLQYPKNLDLLQLISPVFLGYLGAASHFIFQNPTPEVPVVRQFLGMLVRGPIIIYFVVVSGTFAAFAYSNRVGAPIGSGMSVENLSTAISIALGLLAVTTGIISSYLFVAQGPGNA
jgi:hypothetical protein